MTIHRLRYGPDPDQFAHLHLPVAAADPVPVAVVIHGGFWRTRYGIDLADPLAADLAAAGCAALAVEYRRGPGCWPDALTDVAAATDHLATGGQDASGGRLDLRRVAAIGHSAGGQLVGWLAHRTSLPADAPGACRPGSVPVVGAVCQAGVLDLVTAARQRIGAGAVIDFLGGTAESHPDRYRHASPLGHVGDGARIVCVHGDADDDVPHDQSARYVAAAVAASDPAVLHSLPGVGHIDLIDPATNAWALCRSELLAMLGHEPRDADRTATVR